MTFPGDAKAHLQAWPGTISKLGGNSNSWWSGSPASTWYAMDDLVVSTAPIDGTFPGTGTYVIGVGSADTVAPAAPTGLSVQ